MTKAIVVGPSQASIKALQNKNSSSVSVATSSNSVKTAQAQGTAFSSSSGIQTQAAITIKKGTADTLQSLSNVVTTDLQDGYTLIYDAVLGKWVAQPITASTVAVDGGSY